MREAAQSVVTPDTGVAVVDNGQDSLQGWPVAKPNYSFEKRQRELAKKRKKEDKAQKKANPSLRDGEPGDEPAEPGATPAPAAPSEGQP